MRSGAALAAALLLAGCSGRSFPYRDGGDGDADGDSGPPAPDTGLAPPCEERPAPCLTAEATASFEINGYLLGEGGLSDSVFHGLSSPVDEGPALLTLLTISSEPPWVATYVPTVRLFYEGGLASVPREFEETEMPPSSYASTGTSTAGDIVRLEDGSTVAVWRVPVVLEPEPARPELIGFRTDAYWVSMAGLEAAGSFHETPPRAPDGPRSVVDATAVDLGGWPWVVSSGPEALRLSPLDDPDVVVTVAAEARGRVRAAALGGDEAVLAWPEWRTGDVVGTVGLAAVVGPAGVSAGPVEIFPLAPEQEGDLHLAVSPLGIFVARYDRDDGSLRSSRIRIARLDPSLGRIERDRWIDGWGGVEPGGLALVALDEDVWVVFRSRDARYGDYPALYAQALPRDACGYSVAEPAGVLQPHPLLTRGLLAAAGEGEIWVALAYVRDNATGDLFRLAPCE